MRHPPMTVHPVDVPGGPGAFYSEYRIRSNSRFGYLPGDALEQGVGQLPAGRRHPRVVRAEQFEVLHQPVADRRSRSSPRSRRTRPISRSNAASTWLSASSRVGCGELSRLRRPGPAPAACSASGGRPTAGAAARPGATPTGRRRWPARRRDRLVALGRQVEVAGLQCVLGSGEPLVLRRRRRPLSPGAPGERRGLRTAPPGSAACSSAARNSRTCGSGSEPWKPGTSWPPITANTVGMLCTCSIWAIRWLASTSTLASTQLPPASFGQPLQ